ncbi:SH3 domain-containing protein [Limisalsivibrio acetivorans]|uniref:SH3 domain-containing protein n=1 Tax=Limisalsivibrio acetivorans TaxID=1304888 RepID=UPI0003B76725|nr:SH3 domain-containing protein [Limisalsivibrio acetivorans]
MSRILLFVMLLTLPAFAAVDEPVQIGETEGIIEVLGHITTNGVLAREKPDTESRVLARLRRGSKIVVLSRRGEWYKVRLYNRKDAFVSKKYVEFRYELKDEHITKSDIEKKFMVDINNLASQFNLMVKDSVYAKRRNIVPFLKIIDGKKNNGTARVSVLYTAVDAAGKAVPSMKENPLSDIMKKFVELILLKMVLYEADNYSLVFRVPVFNEGDIEGYDDYAVFTIDRKEADLNRLRQNEETLWEYVKSSNPLEQLFVSYPH